MRPLAVQLALLDLPPFTPIPSGQLHYVPALLNWSGEREALRRASPSTWVHMTPLIQVAPRGIAKKKDVAVASIADWAKQLAVAVGSHPIYLDTLGIDASLPTRPRKDATVLALLYQAARRQGLVFVPVYSVGDEAHAPVVAAAVVQDGRGAAIRYRAGNTLHLEASIAETLKSEAIRLGVEAERADVIVDLGFLRPDDELAAADLSLMLDDVAAAGRWRNVVVLATSIPASFGDIAEGTIGAINRQEWALWKELRERRADPIIFGDYGVQHPRAPENKGGGKMRANIRYATPEGMLIARGEGAVTDLSPTERAAQYRKLCHDLVMNQLFVGRGCCSGDDTIQDCADGRLTARGQAMWRGAGTAHNLREVTSSLSALQSRAISLAQSPSADRGTKRPTPPAQTPVAR